MLKWLDNIPWLVLILGSLTLGMAPFAPQPHLLEKILMLINGTLARPIDIFDLCMHGAFPFLLTLKLITVIPSGTASPPNDGAGSG